MSSSQNHHDAQVALESINKRTGRNMPQAIATGAVLVILIAGTLILSPQAFAYLIIVFMVLAIWELRVDFATVDIHISPIALWLCSVLMLLSTYYFPNHLLALGSTLLLSLFVVSTSAAFNSFVGNRVHKAVASKKAHGNLRETTEILTRVQVSRDVFPISVLRFSRFFISRCWLLSSSFSSSNPVRRSKR